MIKRSRCGFCNILTLLLLVFVTSSLLKAQTTYYSYTGLQDSPWNEANTWTTSVNGTDSENPAVPTNNDIVHIVGNRNVVLTADVVTTGLTINIEAGSYLTLGLFQFTNTIVELNGKGNIRINQSYFPTVTTNTFVADEGGTVEYHDFSDDLPTNQTEYYNLWLNNTDGSDHTFTLASDLQVNGDIDITRTATSGSTTLTIGNSVTVRDVVIVGDLNVGTNTSMGVGNFDAIHQIEIQGNLVNDGDIDLTNGTQYAVSTTGAAEVTFGGATDNSITGAGATLDFYRLIVDKGVDPTFILDVNPVAFDLWYVTNLGNGGSDPNPTINKALWIKNGTLKLGSNVNIPVLSEGGSDFFIPLNGGLWVDGATVSSTSAGGGSGNTGLTVIGKFKISNGTYNGNKSAGIVFRGTAEMTFEGGTTTVSQIRRSNAAGTQINSFIHSGGTLNIDGSGETSNTYARLSLESATYGFNMSGGTINIQNPTNAGALAIGCDPGYYFVSGGTINITIPSGNTDAALCSTSPLYNLNIIKDGTGTGGISLQDILSIGAQPLSVLNELTLNSNAVLKTNNLDVSVAGDFTLENGASYEHGDNTTYFTAFGTEMATIINNSGTSPLTFNNVSISKTDAIANYNNAKTLTLPSAGSPSVNILGDLSFDAQYQTLDLNNNQIRLQKNIRVNSLSQILNDPANGILLQPQTPENQNIYIGDLATANNFELDNTSGAKLRENSSMASLTLTNGSLYIGNKVLSLFTPVGGSGFDVDKMISTNGTSGELRYIYNGSGAGTYDYPVGSGASLPDGETLLEWEEDFSRDVFSVAPLWTSTPVSGGTDWAVTGGYARFDGNSGTEARMETPVIDLSGYSSVTLTFNERRPKESGQNDVLVVQYNVGAGWVTLDTYSAEQGSFTERSITLPAACLVSTCRIGFLAQSNGSRNQPEVNVDDVFLTNLVSSTKYTPSSIILTDAGTFSASNSNYIGVIPVNRIHPLYIAGTEDQTLLYYWKTTTNGSYTGTLAFENQFFFYDEDKIIAGGAGAQRAYRMINNQWGQGTSYDDSFSGTDPTGRVTFENTGFQPGEYTGGTVNSFNSGAGLTTYYSRNATLGGDWENTGNTTWSTDDVLRHDGAAVTTQPTSISQVVIAPGHTVTISTNTREANLVQINEGATLDLASTTGHTFDDIRGDGTLRLSSANLPTIALGFSNFTETDRSTIEYYGTTTINIPSSISTYYNLVTSGTGDKNLPDVDLDIRNRLSVLGAPTYMGNVVDDGDLYVEEQINVDLGGTLTIQQGNDRIIEANNINVGASSSFIVENAGTNSHTLTLNEGGIAVNATGSIDFYGNGTNICDVTLSGQGSTSISGTNGSVLLNRLIVNRTGGLVDEVLVTSRLQISGPNTGATKALDLISGTFIIESDGTNPVDITLSGGGSPFYLPETAALISRGTGTVNILRISGGSGLLLNGLFSLSGNAQALFNSSENYIQYSSSGNAQISIEDNAVLNVGGQIRRSTSETSGILTYNQTGGSVYIATQGASQTTRGVFEILNSGSSFTHTGGVLSIGRSSANPGGDIYLEPENYNIGSAATLTIEAATAGQDINLRSNIPLNNLTILGTNTPTVTLNTYGLELEGDFSLTGATFNTNDLDQIYQGNFSNAGAFQETTSASYFSGLTQTITGGTTFYDLYIQPTTSVTIAASTAITVERDMALLTGTFYDGGNYVDVVRHLYNNATHVSSNPAVGGIRLSGSILQNISTYTASAPTVAVGIFGRLEIANTGSGAKLVNDFEVTNDLTLTTGILNIQNRSLTLGINSSIQGSSFGASKMIVSGGDMGDIGITKHFDSSVTGFSFTYPVGVAGEYTPLTMSNVTLGSDSYIKVFPVKTYHPTIVSGDPSRVLQYYWSVTSDITTITADMVFNYMEDDVLGDESLYYSAQLKPFDDTWAKLNTGVNDGANTITFNHSGINSDNFNGFYTAGENDAIPDNIAVYTATQTGSWDVAANWDQPTSPPNGIIVDIPVGIDINIPTDRKRLYKTRIYGSLDISSSTTFHNLGIVSGTGTLVLNNDFLPPGDYTDFIDCGTGTIEYSGAGFYTITNRYLSINNLIISGTGTKKLPNDNFQVCGDLNINATSNLEIFDNRNLNILGDLSKVTTAGFIANTGSRVILGGATAQSLSGTFTGSNAFYDFQLNNSNGLTISDQIEVDNELHITSGIITTANALILSKTSGLIDYSSTDYINGAFSRKLSGTAGTNYFPVGKNGNYKLTAIINPSIADNYWDVEYFNGDPGNTGSTNGAFTVSQAEYWEMSGPNTEDGIIQFSLTGTSEVAAASASLSDLRIVMWNTGTSQWDIVGTDVTISGTINNGTVTTTTNVTFDGTTQLFTLATVDAAPLATATFTSGDVDICGSGSATIEVGLTGTANWQIDVSVDGGAATTYTATASPYTLTPAPTAAGTYSITAVRDNGGSTPGVVFGSDVVVTVNPVPTITLTSNAVQACGGVTSVDMPYTATVGSPDQYSIDFDATAEGQGFADVVDATLPASPIVITVPGAAAAGVYNATLTVTNSTSGCISSGYAITVTVGAAPAATLTVTTGFDNICDGDNTSLSIDFTAGTAPFDFTIRRTRVVGSITNDEALTNISTDPYTYIPSLAPVWVDLGTLNVDVEYQYSILTITDANNCTSTNIGNASVTVFKKPVTGPQYHIINTWGN